MEVLRDNETTTSTLHSRLLLSEEPRIREQEFGNLQVRCTPRFEKGRDRGGF